MSDETLHPGVTLRDWHDTKSLSAAIDDGAKDELEKTFPMSYGGIKLNLEGPLDYEDGPEFSLQDQKAGLMDDEKPSRRIRGNFVLSNEKDGTVLGKRRMTIMRVPRMTQRGTFISNGNEYTVANQARLLPGAYTRKKSTGELETHFNVRRGTGSSFRVRFEPETALYKLDVGQSQLRLYSLLRDIGVPDKELESRWGKDVLKKNQDAYDSRVLDKAYARLVRRPDPAADRPQKVAAIKQAFDDMRLHRRTVSRTLPSLYQDATKSAATKFGCLILRFSREAAVQVIEWSQKTIDQDDLVGDGLEHEVHVTVAFGFAPDVTLEEVEKVVSGMSPISLTLGKIKRFKADVNRPDSDVLVVEVVSPGLQRLNAALRKKFGDRLTSTYKTCNPHMTLGYVVPGAKSELDGNCRFDGQTHVLDHLVYSHRGRGIKDSIFLS